jgi:2-polyprenyl-6-methoxyphenol hydroxylase-like FAD-dependent oxidoreductase
MLAQEGDRWIVTLGGWLGDHAPTDARGFEEFALSLSRPDIYEVVARAKPLTDAVTYKFPANLRRHYERLTDFPEQFLAIGDAVCSFNPFYGQGMSVAALEGLLLDRCLEGGIAGLAPRFYREARHIIDTPWTIAAGSDFAFPGVTGMRPAGTHAINWYMGHLHRAASADQTVCRAFFDVANLLRPASTLFAPRIVSRVIARSFRSRPAAIAKATMRAPGREAARHA